MDQARAITDPNQRMNAASMVYRKWQATDAEAADKGLDNADLTAEQIQQIKSSAGE